jgi:adenosylcobinamide kinase/adenosylcobinamide-phosphate guanylyltransferase
MLILLTGGARSGKSALAVQLAARAGDVVTFVATARAADANMEARIAAHRAGRPAAWRTVEAPVDLAAAIPSAGTVVVDCLAVWTANAMDEPLDVEREAAGAARLAAARDGITIVVTNEVGMGVHPATELGRAYRDVLGRVNAIWSRASDRAFLVVAGRALALPTTDRLLALVDG